MGKIVIDYDIKSSSVKFYINNIEVNDIFSILIHRDITNSYKYTVDIVSDEGRTVVKNGNFESDKQNNIFIEKFLSYFEGDKNE